MSCYQETEGGLIVHVRVQPRASRDRLEGVIDGRLRVRLTAPPLEGEANKACAAFLADVFGVPKSKVTLTAGPKSREKAFKVEGDPSRLAAALQDALGR
jgi:uncharacterized protein (TIGR00251 family)